MREDTVRLWRSDFAASGVELLKASIAPGPVPVKSVAALRVASRLCQSNRRSSARGATRPPSSDFQAARVRHSANAAERLCL